MNKVNSISPFPNTEGYCVSRGERHTLVMIIQIMLDELSLYYDETGPLAVSGVFDLRTENAVKAFQRAGGEDENGVVDRETWNRLAAEYNIAVKDNQ